MRGPESILLIDDEELVVETLKGNFQDQGYHVSTARNGEEGVRKFQNDRFDLVITDLKLKGMDGLQVSRKIKKMNPEVPVIVVTGYPKLLSNEEFTRFGVHDMVLKPFSWGEMFKKVSDCLETPSPASPSDNSPGMAHRVMIPRRKPVERPVTVPKRENQSVSSQGGADPQWAQFLTGQTRVLERLMQGESLKVLLSSMISEMEHCSQGITACVHLLNPEKTQMHLAAGPHLPSGLKRDLKLLSMNRLDNPLDAIIRRNKPVMVEDIRRNNRWGGFRPALDSKGIRAAWSFPLRGPELKAAGVLTFFCEEARSPSSEELRWILLATRLLSVLREYKIRESQASSENSPAGSPLERDMEAVLTFDDRGTIDSFNAAASHLFGYPEKTVLGQNIKTLIPGHSQPHNQNVFKKIEGNDRNESDYMKAVATGVHREGGRLFLDLTVGELFSKEGRRFAATIRNISKYHFAEKVFEETRDSLEGPRTSESLSANKEKRETPNAKEGDSPEGSSYMKKVYQQLAASEKWVASGKLAASLAHEFRNPLFGILNVLERAAREFSLKQGNDDLLDLAIRECYRVMDLVKKLQGFQGPSVQSLEWMDVNAAIRDMVALKKAGLMKNNIQLESDLDPRSPKLNAVGDQIKQVLLNLLNNAEEALQDNEGGGKIHIRTESRDSFLKIQVQDNGVGIPPELRQKIFEPFYTTKVDRGGMGIGMSISREIVQAHGGRIDVHGGPDGKGTVLTLTFPARQGHHPVSRQSRNALSTSLN